MHARRTSFLRTFSAKLFGGWTQLILDMCLWRSSCRFGLLGELGLNHIVAVLATGAQQGGSCVVPRMPMLPQTNMLNLRNIARALGCVGMVPAGVAKPAAALGIPHGGPLVAWSQGEKA